MAGIAAKLPISYEVPPLLHKAPWLGERQSRVSPASAYSMYAIERQRSVGMVQTTHSRRTLLKGGGAAMASLSVLRLTGPARPSKPTRPRR